MRELWLILGLSLAILTESVQAGPAMVVARPQVNIRADATIQSRRVAVLKGGQQVELLGRKHEWLRIRMSDGREGWVHSALVKAILGVSGSSVRVRAADAADAPVIALCNKEDRLLLMRRGDGWTQVQLPNGVVGWIWSGLVRPREVDYGAPSPVLEHTTVIPSGVDDSGRNEEPVEDDAVGPQPRRNPFVEGLQRELEGEYQAALEDFLAVPPDDPAYLKAQTHVARAYRRLGQLDSAQCVLRRTLKLGANARRIYAQMGEVYRLGAQGDSADKYEALSRGEEWKPAAQGGGSRRAPAGGGNSQGAIPAMLAYLVGGSVGLLALIGISIFLLRRGRHRVETRFTKALSDSRRSAQLDAGEFRELERRIVSKQEELRSSLGSFHEHVAKARSTGGAGSEEEALEGLLAELDVLRKGLELQDERIRLYADLVHLQSMLVDMLEQELALRRRRSG